MSNTTDSIATVPPDGSCFYHAVIAGLTLAHPSSRRPVPGVLDTNTDAVRALQLHRAAMLAVHARAHSDDAIMTYLRHVRLRPASHNVHVTDDKILAQYAALIPDPAEPAPIPKAAWADEPEIRATADLTGHPIVIRKGAGETRIDPTDSTGLGSDIVLVLKDEHYSLNATATRAAAAAASEKKASDATKNVWAFIDQYEREHSQPAASARELRRRDVATHELARTIAETVRDDPAKERAVRRRLQNIPDLARRVRTAVRAAPSVDPVATSVSSVAVAACLSLWSVWTVLTSG